MELNINDFCYMRRGKYIRALQENEAKLLMPVEQYTNQTRTALLLLHGFASTPAVFRTLIPQINHYDTIICPHLYYATNWLNIASKFCAQLNNTHKHVDVMGLSLGGVIAYKLSQDFTLRHLYLLAPAFKLRLNITFTLYCARIMHKLGLQTIKNHAGDLYTTDQCELTYKRLTLTGIIELLTFIRTQAQPKINCPTDIFLGKFDHVVHTEYVEQLFKTQAQTNIHWLNKSAHLLPLDGDQQIILDIMDK